MLPVRQNPFKRPTTAPGFNPKHIASNGIVAGNGMCAVVVGGNFVNMVNGKTGTPSATIVTSNFPLLGPTAGEAASNTGSGVQFTGNLSAAPSTQTIAAICYFTNISAGNNPMAVANGGNVNGLILYASGGGGTFHYQANGGGDVDTGITASNNVPYFLALSVNASGANFVAVNLATGKVQTATGAAVTFTASSTYIIGADTFSDTLVGGIAAAMYAPNYLTMSQLVAWAGDPWAFWYPRRDIGLVGVAAAAALVTGWDYIQDDIYPKRVNSISAAPAFVSTFRTAPISGMAWDTLKEVDKLPSRIRFLTDPVSINYRPATVTWAFSVGDTTFLREPPMDTPPGLGRVPSAQPVGISGMAWFEPPDRNKPATKVTVESLPAAFVSTFRTAAISGIGWFEPRDLDRTSTRISVTYPPAFGQPIVQPVGIGGMAWFEPPDRDKRAVKINIEASPALALTPSTLPVPIRGMAWFEPPDRDRPAHKVKFDYPPAFVRFPFTTITMSLSSTESPDLAAFVASFSGVWTPRTIESETWTPATIQSETWTPS